jgi:hypothetical protein
MYAQNEADKKRKDGLLCIAKHLLTFSELEPSGNLSLLYGYRGFSLLYDASQVAKR